ERDGWSVHAVDVADGDLATGEGNRAVVDAALERFGRLDAVVANAGFQFVSPVADFPEDRWDALIAVLLTSPFLLAQYAWDVLEEVILAPQPVRRLLEPAEVADAAAFLLSPGGRAVNGAPLVMDLGWTAR